MCGIIGVLGKNNAPFKAFSGLKNLEYRGYDSWGIAFKSCNGIEIEKKTGKIPREEKGLFNHNSYCAVAHTRWATHGKVTEENAHPIFSQSKNLCVVHNGIVENFEELKTFLESNGFSFRTQTDTEVIANLAEFFLKENPRDFKAAIQKALLKIHGNYAVIFMHRDFFELYCAKNSSPLVLGIGEKELFCASDVTAFLPYTKNAVFLEDFELAVLGNSFSVYDISSGKQLQKQVQKIDWSLESAQKGNFPHFMIKEIFDQKSTVQNAIMQPKEKIKKVAEMISKAKGVFFVGCGTSYHACVSTSYIFNRIAKMHVNVVIASEFRNYAEFLKPETLVIAVSQSGETADVLDAVRTAKKAGSKVISIVNVMGSSLAKLSDEVLLMNSGPEICVLSTKTYTSELAILILLAYSVAGKENEGKELIEKTAVQIPEIIKESEPIAKELAKQFKDKKDLFLIGRDLAFPSALEGALKIKEVSYIHAEGFAGGELKHGTIALIEEGVPVIVLSTGDTRPLTISNAQEVKSRGAFVIGIDSIANGIFDKFIKVQENATANPITMIIPIQLLAYYLAIEKGLDCDKPRNLAKVITVR